MALSSEFAMRRLTLTLTTLVLGVSIVSICSLQFLPELVPSLSRTLTLYCVFVLAVSGLGLYGAIKRNPTLIHIFACHFFIDSLLYLIPRLMVLNFSTKLPSLLCTLERPLSHQNLREAAEYRISSDSLTNQLWKIRTWPESNHCLVWTWSLEVLFASVLLTLMAVQVWAALRMRRYAAWLERRKELEQRSKEIC
jgi:hypothetical protein